MRRNEVEQDYQDFLSLVPNPTDGEIRHGLWVAHVVNPWYYDQDETKPASPYESESTAIMQALLLDGVEFMMEGFAIMPAADLRQASLATETLNEISALVDTFTEEAREWIYRDGNLKDRLHRVVDIYRRRTERVQGNAERFRSHILAEFNGIRIYLRSCMSAISHAEKDARLRGLDETIDSAIELLTKMDIDHLDRDWFVDDSLFAGKSNRARLQRTVWDQEREINDLVRLLQENGISREAKLKRDEDDNESPIQF